MKVKDKNGRILESENPVICGIWKKAEYEEFQDEAANEPVKNGNSMRRNVRSNGHGAD